MTLQIAIRASEGYVLASDLSTRTTDPYGSPVMRAHYPKYESKTRINKRHGIAFALSGVEPTGVNSLDDLDEALTSVELPADYAKWLEQWATAYSAKQPEFRGSFLVVYPSADANRILKLFVEQENVRAIPDQRWMLHPDPSNPATFWPQYCHSQNKPTVEAATRIAALAILMAGELSPQGIWGLEVAQFRDGKWKQLPESDIDKIDGDFKALQESINQFLGRE